MNNSPMGNYVEDKTMKFDLNSMLSAPVAAAGTTAIKEIPIDMLVPYGKHPFTLYSGERLDDMVQSVKANGILTPILVRELNGKYEILVTQIWEIPEKCDKVRKKRDQNVGTTFFYNLSPVIFSSGYAVFSHSFGNKLLYSCCIGL